MDLREECQSRVVGFKEREESGAYDVEELGKERAGEGAQERVAEAACEALISESAPWSDGHRMLTVRALDEHARLRSLHSLLALPATLTRELPQPARPPARPLTQQHEPLSVPRDARDRERMRLRKAGAEPRELDADEAVAGGAVERGERRGREARFEYAEGEVEDVEEARGEDVARELGLVLVDLRAGCVG
jgi:hypothetical protein